jgi:predicted nucleotidyltransferase
MRFCAIICEYNPLHLGHAYHIRRTLEELKPDVLVCVMSGNFVQRGEPAVKGKFTRAAWAIKAGADVVLELPAVFACAPAENFALGAVSILSRIRAVKHLSFGSESGDIDRLHEYSEKLRNKDIKETLKEGESYASSFADADFLSNNILAVEYIRAIDRLSSHITPFTVKRMGSDYNSLSKGEAYCSASFLRKALSEGDFDAVKKHTPQYVWRELKQASFDEALFAMACHAILTRGPKALEGAAYVSEGLHNRIYRAARESLSFAELVEKIRTKRYPSSKVRRILINILLGVDKELVESAKGGPFYARVLALKKGREDVLAEIKKDLPLIARSEDYRNFSCPALEVDILSSHIYYKISREKVNDFSAGLVKV